MDLVPFLLETILEQGCCPSIRAFVTSLSPVRSEIMELQDPVSARGISEAGSVEDGWRTQGR